MALLLEEGQGLERNRIHVTRWDKNKQKTNKKPQKPNKPLQQSRQPGGKIFQLGVVGGGRVWPTVKWEVLHHVGKVSMRNVVDRRNLETNKPGLKWAHPKCVHIKRCLPGRTYRDNSHSFQEIRTAWQLSEHLLHAAQGKNKMEKGKKHTHKKNTNKN